MKENKVIKRKNINLLPKRDIWLPRQIWKTDNNNLGYWSLEWQLVKYKNERK